MGWREKSSFLSNKRLPQWSTGSEKLWIERGKKPATVRGVELTMLRPLPCTPVTILVLWLTVARKSHLPDQKIHLRGK
jgi:hypothetical protein